MSTHSLLDRDGLPFWEKDENEYLDYSVDYTDWLNEVSDTINSASIVVPSGINVATTFTNTTRHTAWISGGTKGQDYTFESRIFTTAGRKAVRSFKIKVRDK